MLGVCVRMSGVRSEGKKLDQAQNSLEECFSPKFTFKNSISDQIQIPHHTLCINCQGCECKYKYSEQRPAIEYEESGVDLLSSPPDFTSGSVFQ